MPPARTSRPSIDRRNSQDDAARYRLKSNLDVLGVEIVWDSLEFQQIHFGHPELRLVVEDYLVLLVGGGRGILKGEIDKDGTEESEIRKTREQKGVLETRSDFEETW